MLDMLNGLDEVAWAGLAGFLGVILTAIGAAWRGTKKTPVEVGVPLPPPSLVDFTLEEARAIRRRLEDEAKASAERHDEAERLLNAIHQDTQILRDRRDR
ncbi:hypothetical protein [Frigidibacter sp. MR17.24]|uniref:hypothetical protein n=1 Tax=Frigidibacter sp. MR17.24 TaxID=3127345 RepID=UPI003012F05B